MDRFITDFRKRESRLEEELKTKEELIRSLKEENLRQTKSRGFGHNMNEDEKSTNYVEFLQKRLDETLAENKRYHAKYIDMREFAYSSVESLMRQLNSRKNNAI